MESLKDSEERFRSVVETAPDAIINVDGSGNIIFWNRAAEKMFGYSAGAASGRPLTFIMPERFRETHNRGLYRAVLSGETRINGKTFITVGLKRDGSEIPLELSLAICNAKGELFFTGIIRDITERKRIDALGIASMSHELRTPLTAIIGFSELLKQKAAGDLNQKQEHYVDNVHTSSIFLLNLISDILDLSKIKAGKIEPVIEKMSVPSAIEEAIILLKEKAAKHNIILKKELDPQLELIEADRQRFKQILLNLLSNAVKFSKEEGIVTVTAKKMEDTAKISVSDTGMGIKPENLGKLFCEFEQLDSGIAKKYGGTGLGLAISKQLVELHGGKIWAESRYGEGSTFTFSLPLKAGLKVKDK